MKGGKLHMVIRTPPGGDDALRQAVAQMNLALAELESRLRNLETKEEP